MATIRLEIVTVEKEVYSEEVNILVAPGIDGELTILPNHAPLLTQLNAGEIRILKEDEESFISVSGGFLEVLGNKITILADTAERSEEIDVERAEQAVTRAKQRIESSTSDLDLERAVASLRRSQFRAKVGKRRSTRRRRDRG